MLDETQILNIVAEELVDSSGGAFNGDSLLINFEDSLGAYLGASESVPPGRSSVVSTDVADAIEWIMPEIIKAFTQNNDIVTFDPVFEGDERQAELESKYVYDILMKDNDGFIILHQFVKDALMQKNGFIKVFYSDYDEYKKESFTGLTEPEYKMISAKEGYEAIEETSEIVDGIPIFDVKFRIKKSCKKLNVISIPPEEFAVNRMHNSISLKDARFTAHQCYKTKSDLIKMGFDRDTIEDLASNPTLNEQQTYRFTFQGEGTTFEAANDSANDIIEIAECYMQIDINEDGISELKKITVVGWDNPDKILSIEDIDEIPFISTTAILMSHKLYGLSIYDRIIEIQNQKTSLWRNILDNMYLQNNQRTIVIEGQVNLDDLMISRPGGIIRAKRADAVLPFPTPQLSGESYKMMDYLDQVRAGRAGVSPDGAIQESNIGDRVGSQGVDRMMNAKEELVGLMVRVIAETGIKPLCYMIRRLVMKHQDVVKEYKFRGKWVPVDPSKWSERSTSTVRVGTGSGNRKEQAMTLQGLAVQQQAIKAMPGQVLVTPSHEFALLNDIAKLGGFPSASPYFLDPISPEGQQHAKQVSEQMAQQQQKVDANEAASAQAELKYVQVEQQKVQLQGELGQAKHALEEQKALMELQKQTAAAQMAELEAELKAAQSLIDDKNQSDELTFKYWDRTKFYETEQEKIDVAEDQVEATSDESSAG